MPVRVEGRRVVGCTGTLTVETRMPVLLKGRAKHKSFARRSSIQAEVNYARGGGESGSKKLTTAFDVAVCSGREKIVATRSIAVGGSR